MTSRARLVWNSHSACGRKTIRCMSIYHKIHVMVIAFHRARHGTYYYNSESLVSRAAGLSTRPLTSTPNELRSPSTHAQFLRSDGARAVTHEGTEAYADEKGQGNEGIILYMSEMHLLQGPDHHNMVCFNSTSAGSLPPFSPPCSTCPEWLFVS